VSAGTAGSKKITIDELFEGWGMTVFGKSIATAADVAAAKTILGYGTAADATLGGDAGEVPIWITAPIVPTHVVAGTGGSQITSMTFAELEAELSIPTVPAYASQVEAEAGTENTKLMTPLRTAEAIAALGGGGGGTFASQAEAEAGTDTTKYMNPLRTAEAIAALATGTGDVTLTGTQTLTNKTLSTGTVFSAAPTMTLGSDGTGDVYYRAAGGALTRLAAGTDGHILTLASGLPSWAAAAGGALTNWTESVNTSAPNATVPVVRFLATNAAANVDIALSPKGTGAITAHVADNTSTGGNKRGTYAVDLQTVRSANTQVASGTYSVIAGGRQNTASGTYGAVGGGIGNTAGSYAFVGSGSTVVATPDYSVAVGGLNNTINASRDYSFLGGGQSNTIGTAGTHHALAGGQSNTTSATHSTVGGGFGNTASGEYSTIAGGRSNTASGANSVAGGYFATSRGLQCANAWAAGRFASTGDSQAVRYVHRRETTNATPAGLGADGAAPAATSAIVLPNNSTYRFTANVAARTSAGVSYTVRLTGAIERGANAAATAIVGAVTQDVVEDAGAAAWDATAIANTTLGSLEIQVTGEAATTIRWVAQVETVEVVY
jgi:hypothetical protein